MSQTLLFDIEGSIATITINRPQARNALTLPMYAALKKACDAASANAALRVLIITGAGQDAFAAGTDINEFRAFTGTESALAYENFMEEVLSAVERCRLPTIAAISGACTGGGAAIAARCDLRIAADTLRFGFPIARTLGNCLSQANLAQLASLIGPARVKDMIFTARLIAADEALAIGLVTEVVGKSEALNRARECAVELSDRAPLTLFATKEGLRRERLGERGHDQDLISLCYGSDDFREGMDAFLNKRSAAWSGR